MGIHFTEYYELNECLNIERSLRSNKIKEICMNLVIRTALIEDTLTPHLCKIAVTVQTIV